MKTMAIDYAKKLDNAIDDVNKEYAIEAGVKIANDLQGALIAYGITWLYLADGKNSKDRNQEGTDQRIRTLL